MKEEKDLKVKESENQICPKSWNKEELEKIKNIKLVLDTNVLISSTLWKNSSSQKLLLQLIKSNAEIYYSDEIIKKKKKVLDRDFDYSEKEIEDIVIIIKSFSINVDPRIKLDVVKEDPDDNKILECASESKSDYVITYDKHLLRIKKFDNIKIITPEEAKRILNF